MGFCRNRHSLQAAHFICLFKTNFFQMKLFIFCAILFLGGIFHSIANPFLPLNIPGQTHSGYISERKIPNGFILAEAGQVAAILIAEDDHPGLTRVAGYFQNDLYNVTGYRPELFVGSVSGRQNVVIVGTIGKSSIIDQLAASGKINVAD
ncbi:MAG TPA: hypothetical protein DCM62_01680, partial [Bacteroidales bacterium]|nr:hypothetical protein [Bacteroidales bacterium]